ncbi:Uncharacterised protein [Chlamydia trachomatis]|nr:Uncharacterised protein [Chlamydia trachomatis]
MFNWEPKIPIAVPILTQASEILSFEAAITALLLIFIASFLLYRYTKYMAIADKTPTYPAIMSGDSFPPLSMEATASINTCTPTANMINEATIDAIVSLFQWP